ncbi:MAG: hypothetical protein A2Z73_03380 [Deltaproteobacteria bacterium RBG_13_60_28]|nr:MAG: hypothetical protein A2Z73_03380 [Deltaproteobacteria bacterium RBG_13_60_28]
MAAKYYMALDDSPDHAAALGRLLGHWAILETKLMHMMEILLNVDHHRADFVYKEFVSISSKITLLKRLNRWLTKDESLKDEIKNLLSKAGKLNTQRNDFIHARWLSVAHGDYSNKLIRISISSPRDINELHKPSKRFTAQDIQDVVEEIVKLSLSFQKLLDRMLKEKLEQAPE